MTQPTQPNQLTQSGNPTAWWWQRRDTAGAVITTEKPEVFPSRGDAESWLGEAWADLAEEGVAAVVLHEGDREVYGPMSLEAG
ncbi:MAG: hypothetical protein ACTHJH_09160 [Marmoricola sp.]